MNHNNCKVLPSFRDHARALLLSLDLDPSPHNVDKTYQLNERPEFEVNQKKYLVVESSDISSMLMELMLQNPLALPANRLSLLISGAFDPNLDFEHIIQVAECLKSNPSFSTIYTTRVMIEKDKFLGEHLKEILDFEFGSLDLAWPSVRDFLGFNFGRIIQYRNKQYYVLGDPK